MDILLQKCVNTVFLSRKFVNARFQGYAVVIDRSANFVALIRFFATRKKEECERGMRKRNDRGMRKRN